MDSAYHYIPPAAEALVESLRGVGYSTATAIADIIDNSISAGARNVWIDFRWNGIRSSVTILDDGSGMTADELTNAMRLGGRGPLKPGHAIDLGRFGLGLKTASFSQCRSVTVASRRSGDTTVCRWDLDHIVNVAKDWHLLIGAAPGSTNLLASLDALESGTLVLWEKLDRISGNENESTVLSQNNFLETMERVEEHLAIVFHRFLEGGRPSLQLFINGASDRHRILPWDPFLADHPATLRRPLERIPTRTGIVDVQAFVLPHKDHLSLELYDRAGGHDGWAALQGFYVYRNRRLLVAGSWLGLGIGKLWTKEGAHKLARLRLDISNAADEEWKIDVKKSVAHPPLYMRPRLRALAEDARQLARQVFAHRGGGGPLGPSLDLARVWKASKKQNAVAYLVDRTHLAVKQVLEQAGSLLEPIETMLRLIEESVPVQRIWLDSVEAGEVQKSNFEASADVKKALILMYRDLRMRVGLGPEQARSLLLKTEPFDGVPDLVEALPDDP